MRVEWPVAGERLPTGPVGGDTRDTHISCYTVSLHGSTVNWGTFTCSNSGKTLKCHYKSN